MSTAKLASNTTAGVSSKLSTIYIACDLYIIMLVILIRIYTAPSTANMPGTDHDM